MDYYEDDETSCIIFIFWLIRVSTTVYVLFESSEGDYMLPGIIGIGLAYLILLIVGLGFSRPYLGYGIYFMIFVVFFFLH
ncbi:MAG: hypothetical protein LBT40_01845 [Deltaproteobacteria bacterium]|jgi:hypothetical protein|nr:hypothetical protein [Deltaproteobacteria bacterium]